MRFVNTLLLTILAGWLQNACAAEITPVKKPLEPVKQQPQLTLSGKDGPVRLKLSEIERLPMQQTTMQTKWGMNGTFQGVLMSDLMAAGKLDRNARRIVFHTHDNYVAGLSKGEFDNSPAMLATRFNGQPIPLDSKGPFILIWPTKAEAVLQGKAPLSSWIWSVSEISTQ